MAERIRKMRILGIDKETWNRYKNTRSYLYEVVSDGFRYHMPNFCAAVGLEQLKKFPVFAARRRKIVSRYQQAFAGIEGLTPVRIDTESVVPHLFIVRVAPDRRDAFMEFLKERGVGTGVHYIANHTQPHFSRFCPDGLPRSEQLWREIVTLPLHCAMSDNDVELVVDSVSDFFSREKSHAIISDR